MRNPVYAISIILCILGVFWIPHRSAEWRLPSASLDINFVWFYNRILIQQICGWTKKIRPECRCHIETNNGCRLTFWFPLTLHSGVFLKREQGGRKYAILMRANVNTWQPISYTEKRLMCATETAKIKLKHGCSGPWKRHFRAKITAFAAAKLRLRQYKRRPFAT